MARIAELTSHLQLADSKSVHFHAEVRIVMFVLNTVSPLLNFPWASVKSMPHIPGKMYFCSTFFGCGLLCVRIDVTERL